jgi:hypothetical protein
MYLKGTSIFVCINSVKYSGRPPEKLGVPMCTDPRMRVTQQTTTCASQYAKPFLSVLSSAFLLMYCHYTFHVILKVDSDCHHVISWSGDLFVGMFAVCLFFPALEIKWKCKSHMMAPRNSSNERHWNAWFSWYYCLENFLPELPLYGRATLLFL